MSGGLLLQTITDFGDTALLAPASILLFVYLWAYRARAQALVWARTLLVSLAAILVLKILFHACGTKIAAIHLRTPSGHATFSMTFYACFLRMAAGDRDRATRRTFVAAGAGIAVAIGVSRVLLGLHSVAEVVLGLAVGTSIVGYFLRCYARLTPRPMPWLPFLALLAVLAAVSAGSHVDLEDPIERIAQFFRFGTGVCR